MCGILGYLGKRPALPILIEGLKKLEYRGYDSAGVALMENGKTTVIKSQGRLEQTLQLLEKEPESLKKITCGMGHTRWATHGEPSTRNAHPHRAGHVTVIHNGVIENDFELRTEVLAQGYQLLSDTDSEVFAYLILQAMDRKGLSLRDAVQSHFVRLRGQSSILVASDREPGVLVAVRRGSPLVFAEDPQGGGGFIASDARPLIPYQREVTYLQHGDLLELTSQGVHWFSVDSEQTVVRSPVLLDWSEEKLELGTFPHFMLKEIYEQPQALQETLQTLLNRSHGNAVFEWISGGALEKAVRLLQQAQELILVACGSSWHAAWLGKYWIEKWAKIPVGVELSSEFRYRLPVVRPGTVVVGVSQSGETADTLAVLREMKSQGVPTLGISNMRGSSIARETDAVFYTAAGIEVGVASTKAFFAQMAMVCLWAGHLSGYRLAQPWEERKHFFESFIRLPEDLALFLKGDQQSLIGKQLKELARALPPLKGFFFIGRGYAYPMALEGALKLKEISYEHAEGYPAGELKHGPLAMIDSEMGVIVLAPQDAWREKTLSNLQEVKSRGACVIGVGDEADHELRSLCHFWVSLGSSREKKQHHPDLAPFWLAPVLQLLSYERGVLRGKDVDKPRNLAKSVTVE